MSDGKCENRPIGINKIGELPKRIAEFLKLPDPQLYTGHCFRRTSATLLVDGGADITTLKRHTAHKSTTVAEGYINESLQNKINTGNTIVKSIDISASKKYICFEKRTFENIDSLPSTSKKLPRMGFSHAKPSTSTGKLHPNHRVIIPEIQTSETSDLSSQWATVGTQLTQSTVYHGSEIDDEVQEFAEEFSSEIAGKGTPQCTNVTINKDFNNSQQLANLLNLDKKFTIELKNCSNITFNLIEKKKL